MEKLICVFYKPLKKKVYKKDFINPTKLRNWKK